VLGLILAFGFNVVRTLILTWQAASHGVAALEKWHDPAGLTIFLASFACLWAVAGWLRIRGNPKRRTTNHAPGNMDPASRVPHPASEAGRGSTVEVQSSRLDSFSEPSPAVRGLRSVVSSPRTFLFALGFWSLLCILATEVWYRSHDKHDSGFFHWSFTFPTNNPDYREIELSETVRSKIGHDSGGGASWTGGDGTQWSVYFFRWNPASIQSVLRARIHRPERCLPAAGLRRVADSGVANFEAAGLQLPFRQYTYEAEGRTLHVFFCQWEDGSERQAAMATSNQEGRLDSVLVGRRKLGQQTLEVILTGPATLEEAARKLRDQLPALIRAEAPAQGARADGPVTADP
jgi:hypothetical protein